MDDQASSIINQLKAQLVNTSAELLIAKGRIDELEREKKRLASAVDQSSASLAAARKEAEAQQSAANAERISQLSTTVSKLNGEVRKAEEERHGYAMEVQREKDVSSSLRSQLESLQAGAGESTREQNARLRELHDKVSHLEAEVASGKSRESRLCAERNELQLKVEQLFRSSQDSETRESSLERDCEALKERLTRSQHDAESSAQDANSRAASLMKRNAELQEALSAAENSCSTLRAKVDSLQTSKTKSDGQVSSLLTRASSEKEEYDRLLSRWEMTDRRMAEAENEIMYLKSQLADAQTQLQIERSKLKTMESLVAAHNTPGSPSGRSLAQALDAETAQNAALRAALRSLSAEKDTAADILSSIGPLPDFVRRRAQENETAVLSSGTSREAAARNARLAFHYDTEEGVMEGGTETVGGAAAGGLPDSPLRGEGSISGASATPSIMLSLNQSTILGHIRRLAKERPLIIESLNFMDLELRKAQMERDRLSGQLQTAKGAEEAKEHTLVSTKKQLKGARDEVLDVSAARDFALERASKAESEVRGLNSELLAKRDALEAEKRVHASVSADLDECRNTLSLTRYELDSCRVELERAITHHAGVEKRLKEENVNTLLAANASKKDLEAAHDKVVKQLLSKAGALEGEVDGLRQDLSNTSQRLSAATMELERTRSEVSTLRSNFATEELKLAESEKSRRTLESRLRDLEGTRQRLEKERDSALEERDSKSHEVSLLKSEMTTIRSRLQELGNMETTHREDEARLGLLQTRTNNLEIELHAAHAETEAAQMRITTLTMQAHQDLEIAHAATAKVAHELDRLHKRKAMEAEELQSLTEQSRSTITSLRSESDSLNADCQQLRERCRMLQLQSAQLANELQEEKDKYRRVNDSCSKAVAERLVSFFFQPPRVCSVCVCVCVCV